MAAVARATSDGCVTLDMLPRTVTLAQVGSCCDAQGKQGEFIAMVT